MRDLLSKNKVRLSAGGSQCFQWGPVLGRTSWELLRPWELSRPKCLEMAALESSQVMLVLCGSGGPEDLVVWVSVNLAGMPTTGPPTDLAWQLDWRGWGGWGGCAGALVAPGTSLPSCWLFSGASLSHGIVQLNFTRLLTSPGIAVQHRFPSAGPSEAERCPNRFQGRKDAGGCHVRQKALSSHKEPQLLIWLGPAEATLYPYLFP